MAAAIGAGLPSHEPVANMVVDVGGGTSETALISLGGIVALKAVRIGSFDIDAAISSFIRREYGIAVGERTAEERSEEHTSELQSLMRISYAVFCLKKKKS